MPQSGAALTALLFDVVLGEPPTWLHPTAAMGRAIGAVRTRADGGRSPSRDLMIGLALVGGGGALIAMLTRRASRLADGVSHRSWIRALVAGAGLKPALSLRALLHAGRVVEDALRQGDIVRARRLLAWHLVSRDTSRLAPHEVAGAAIESLAENLGDGLVAPLLAYAFADLPGAYVHRFVNTADAMLGYHTPELEWLGKPGARLDDVLNLLPARLTAGLLAGAAPLVGASTAGALRVLHHDRARTASPNAGWPMAAAAGALGVRLDKRGAYTLNAQGRRPTPADLARARRLVAAAAASAVVLTEIAVADATTWAA